jgi:multidrug efflux pump subunit AcrB
LVAASPVGDCDVCVLVFSSTFVVNRYIGRDWMPQEDQSELSIQLEMPEGSSIQATEKTTLEVAQRVAKSKAFGPWFRRPTPASWIA